MPKRNPENKLCHLHAQTILPGIVKITLINFREDSLQCHLGMFGQAITWVNPTTFIALESMGSQYHFFVYTKADTHMMVPCVLTYTDENNQIITFVEKVEISPVKPQDLIHSSIVPRIVPELSLEQIPMHLSWNMSPAKLIGYLNAYFRTEFIHIPSTESWTWISFSPFTLIQYDSVTLRILSVTTLNGNSLIPILEQSNHTLLEHGLSLGKMLTTFRNYIEMEWDNPTDLLELWRKIGARLNLLQLSPSNYHIDEILMLQSHEVNKLTLSALDRQLLLNELSSIESQLAFL